MKLLTLALLAAAGTTALVGPTRGAAVADPRGPLPAESWAPRDTADSLWRRGRIAISEEAWERAASSFRSIVKRYPKQVRSGGWEA